MAGQLFVQQILIRHLCCLCPQESYSTVFPFSFWFCSLDVSARSQVLVTRDSVGHVTLLNMDGREVCSLEPRPFHPFPYPQPWFCTPPELNPSLQFWNLRMHKKKVTHMALNPCCDWLLATAPVDQTVKIWDLRQVRGKSSFLHSLPHGHPVNAGVIH